jgi:ketosteroid isomerase-like protein
MSADDETKRLENLRIIDAFYAAIRAGDAAAQEALLHEDIEIHEADALPYGGSYKGLGGFRLMSRLLFECWKGLDYRVGEIAAGPDYAFVVLYLSAMGHKTGKAFSFTCIEFWRFQDGKIRSISPHYWDTKRAAECFGA